MQYLGVNYEIKHIPELDPGFIPFGVWRAAYLKDAKQPIAIAVDRGNDQISVHKTFIHGNNERIRLDCIARAVEFYIRLMKKC